MPGNHEAEFRELGHEYGFVPMRAPASGSAIVDDLPDVLMGSAQRSLIIAAECKYRGKGNDYAREPNEKVEALLRFAEGFHDECVPVIACRWSFDTNWYIHEVDGSERNDAGHFNTTRDRCTEEWLSFDEWLMSYLARSRDD